MLNYSCRQKKISITLLQLALMHLFIQTYKSNIHINNNKNPCNVFASHTYLLEKWEDHVLLCAIFGSSLKPNS